jgi:hypothetical protein
MLGWVIAALAVGLWYGEMQRRRAAERTITYGSPAGSLRKPTSMAPSAEAEDRFLAAVSEETVVRTAEALKRQAEARGIEGMSDADFERDARDLLAGHDVESG